LARNPSFPIVNVQETPKTRWRAVPYTGGRGLDLGCGGCRLFDTEFCVGIDNGSDVDIGAQIAPNMSADAKELSIFGSGQWDYVYSSHLLHYFPYEETHKIVREWMRVIKTGACVVLYLPDERLYPKVAEPARGINGEPMAHPKQKWNVNYDRVVELMEKTTWNWDLCDYQVCERDDEYSLFFAFRKLK